MAKPIVHFEIGVNNLPEAVDFYRDIFGWEISPHGNTAPIQTGPEGALPGHLNQLGPNDPQQYVTVYIETDELERDLEQVVAKGGSVFVGPLPLPDGRSFAWFRDVAGNIMGLISPLPPA